jgi:hypothetical protein
MFGNLRYIVCGGPISAFSSSLCFSCVPCVLFLFATQVFFVVTHTHLFSSSGVGLESQVSEHVIRGVDEHNDDNDDEDEDDASAARELPLVGQDLPPLLFGGRVRRVRRVRFLLNLPRASGRKRTHPAAAADVAGGQAGVRAAFDPAFLQQRPQLPLPLHLRSVARYKSNSKKRTGKPGYHLIPSSWVAETRRFLLSRYGSYWIQLVTRPTAAPLSGVSITTEI